RGWQLKGFYLAILGAVAVMTRFHKVQFVQLATTLSKGGSRWGRGGKKATLEALFAALRPHGSRPRTWNRRPTRER
ncbi:MAG TPA: hypothetical protein PLB66_07250, partial [Bacteroidales bacterium]|nr:hypothetical protein [Bacteroidales bacterium]